MASLITYEQAQTHLRMTDEEYQEDILLKMDLATGIVLDYLQDYRERVAPVWTVATNPEEDFVFACVQAAILEVLGHLMGFRGDSEKTVDGPMTANAQRILRGLKDPVVS
jgi:hypothetical protein